MSRFDYIKGRRGRNKQQETIKSLEQALIKSANETVNRVAKVLNTPENKSVMEHRASILDEALQPEKISFNSEDSAVRITNGLKSALKYASSIELKDSPEEVKKRKLIKIDRFLLKQKVAKLHSRLDSLKENTISIVWLKEAMRNIFITRIKEIEELTDSKAINKKLCDSMTGQQLAFLATMTNKEPKSLFLTLGQMLDIAHKMGITLNLECIKSPLPVEEAIDRKGSYYCQYIDGVKG